jgi:hypothetical protein
MNSKKINQLATELTPSLSDLTIIGDPSTGVSKKITLSQMASLFTGTVEEYPSFASLPLVGVADTIYITTDTNILYRWDTTLSAYAELSPNIVTSLVFSDANGFDGNISLVGSVATLTITTALTQGSVSFIGASGALSQDNDNFFWDDTNNRLGIGTKLPTTALDVFGSGIIGRINGTSTNNAFLGFASAGTNKWSIGNVQSDHRFRIYSEANTSELVSVLQTGEFGIGIANPTTKLHIDGGASALIANLDADVSVAKSISFRSDNSSRFNIEVSGTESGSNAGADFQIKRYSDAGAYINTALTITRSTGAVTLISNLTLGSDVLISNTAATKKGYTYTSPASAWGPQTSGLYFTPNNAVDAKTTFTLELWNGVGNIITPLTIADTGNATFAYNLSVTGNLNVTGVGGNVAAPVAVDYLVVAGGGGGGADLGGGGGAGGFLAGTAYLTKGTFSVVQVGQGGRGASTSGSFRFPEPGGISSLFGIIAYGGGGGGCNISRGYPGASGGGGSREGYAGGRTLYPNQGFAGGQGGTGSPYYVGGGGGGADGAGGNGTTDAGGAGGIGKVSDITGTSTYYAGGGGGAGYGGGGGTGGLGGGGNGSSGSSGNTSGTANTGGGGGGGGNISGIEGSSGGSGIVIIKYADTYPTSTCTGTFTYAASGGFRRYTFTGNGTIKLMA